MRSKFSLCCGFGFSKSFVALSLMTFIICLRVIYIGWTAFSVCEQYKKAWNVLEFRNAAKAVYPYWYKIESFIHTNDD